VADDNLKTALTGAGLGAVLLEVIRRTADAWQRRDQQRAQDRQKRSAAEQDAADQLRRYLERQIEDLRRELRQVEEEAADRERRFLESERREAQVRQSVVEFAAVVSVLLPEVPDRAQHRLQAALDRMRQVSGLG
jgi:signal transduction histidine kinase